ncbi:hypothetical protein JOB18_046781 [Solea senegalensis]|uniref:Reverse transcriptase n=1 Tax=Solea senegalensis TaxID=28829 RepID=A0AAV6SG99_SOLSE|nr:hypothetical protein JOB18_046781 [Solea senegalensis]
MESGLGHYDPQTWKRSTQHLKLSPHKPSQPHREILFLVYISDIYYPPATIAKVSQFADDLCYWSSSKRPNLAAKKLQTCITEIETWTNMWRIKLNPVKTQCILFTKNSHLQPNNIDLSLNNHKITISKEATFLGVTFQNNMTWTKHINNLEQRANNRLNHLKALCGKHGASPLTVIKVYRAYIRPLFEYYVPAWINISDNQLQRLEVIQNKALKLAHRLPSYISNHYIHIITGIQTVRQRHQVIALKYTRTAINPSLQKTIQEAHITVDTPMSFMLQLARDFHSQNSTKHP